MVADDHTVRPILFVVFGIPGAGKTTIAKHVVQTLLSSTPVDDDQEGAATTVSPDVLDLDLDDCVPGWMRLNFAQGIYPTLQQRNQFAVSCCDYVNESIQQFTEANHNGHRDVGEQTLLVIVSFSFVNDDLRINFRQQFPNSYWILIHTSDKEAQRRIQLRDNHLYKGKPQHPSDSVDSSACHQSSSDNNEWNFAPVTFPHAVVNGHNPIEQTSSEIVTLIQTNLQLSLTITGH